MVSSDTIYTVCLMMQMKVPCHMLLITQAEYVNPLVQVSRFTVSSIPTAHTIKAGTTKVFMTAERQVSHDDSF